METVGNIHYDLINLSKEELDKKLDQEIKWAHNHFCGDSKVENEHLSLIEAIRNRPGTRYLGTGCHRHTFMLASGKFVVKVPRNPRGTDVNKYEAELYEKKRKGLCERHIARCKLLGKLLVMEAVANDEKTVMAHPDFNQDWVGLIDCKQVGVTRQGELVAYDFG